MKYMVCDAAGEAIKASRSNDAIFDTEREARQFIREHVAKVDAREESDYQIIPFED